MLPRSSLKTEENERPSDSFLFSFLIKMVEQRLSSPQLGHSLNTDLGDRAVLERIAHEGEARNRRDLVEFTIALCKGLHRSGLSTGTVEAAARKMASIFNFSVGVFVVPTATLFTFGDEEGCVPLIAHQIDLTSC